jgi:hypothetical protein
MTTTKIRYLSSRGGIPTAATLEATEIERIVSRPNHSDILVAEFWHDHSKICFAYFVHGKPYIQLHGGQMDLSKAKATGAALDLAYDWLMEQVDISKMEEVPK